MYMVAENYEHTHTRRTTTVTLAAHARGGLTRTKIFKENTSNAGIGD